MTLSDLIVPLEAEIGRLDRRELPKLVGALARLEALARLRLADVSTLGANGRTPTTEKPAAQPERLLNSKDAAALLGVDARWLYRRADRLPFTRRLSPRTLRFSEAGIRRWLETRR